MEVGPSFRSTLPRYPVADPGYRILARQRCRYTHSYFSIRVEVLGPMAMCVGSFLPFQITYYLNGHHYIERELLRCRIAFRKDDNAFLAVADPAALQAAADRLNADLIRKRLDYWTLIVGPKFSPTDETAAPWTTHVASTLPSGNSVIGQPILGTENFSEGPVSRWIHSIHCASDPGPSVASNQDRAYL